MVVIDSSRSRFEAGYWNELRQPVFIFDIRFTKSTIQRKTLERYDRIIEALLPQREPLNLQQIVAEHPLLSRLARSSISILAASGMPTMSGANALPIRRPDGVHWHLGLCAVSADILAPQWAIGWSARLLRVLEGGREISIDSLGQDLTKLITACKQQAPAGVNTLRLLQAAHEEQIPWRHVANNVYQFGWGSRARWLDSSFTDETPRISVSLARDKQSCAAVLRQAGLPVPRHRLVTSEAQAVEAAQALGYPVVVKPADLDGGRGVFVGLRDALTVHKGYTAARKVSQRILVEEYVPGQDYRLQVFKEEVFSVIHRRPAYVVGDGIATVEELIHRANLEREQPSTDHRAEQARMAIVIDDEVHDWLQYQGLTLTCVPAHGQPVRLCGAANVSAGGSREEVLQKAHRDNLELALRASRVLRLDLAGVDLLIPDISRSWKESGAAICEVNAQPQISRDLLRPLLLRLLPSGGRIPVVAMVGRMPLPDSMRESLAVALLADAIRLGWVDAQEPSSMVGDDAMAGCRALLADPGIDALIWHLPAWPASLESLPFDRIDALVLLEPTQLVPDSCRRLSQISLQIWRVFNAITPDDEGVPLQSLPARLADVIKKRLHMPINSKPICSVE